jgi:hypothetical protein
MTDRPNQNDSKSYRIVEESASSTAPPEPLQLDLFERWTGVGGWTEESPRESKPSRHFILPTAPLASPVVTEAPPVFGHWVGVYRQCGYWPRPISSGTKACHEREWQKPDSELSEAMLASWLTSHAHFGIGLLMGSPFPDGTTLGALDIDRDEYVPIGRVVLGDPPSGRIGKKGAVFFVRVRGRPSNPAFMIGGEAGKRYGKVAECLFIRKLCVIPPTIHPETGQPYRWIGRPLHEVDFNELPIVEVDDGC